MKRWRLNLAAVISMLVAIASIAGHFFRADCTTRYVPAGPSPAFCNEVHFTFGRGMVRAISSTWRPPLPPISAVPTGLSVPSPPIRIQRESATVHRALWDFRCGALPVMMGCSVFQVGFPLWCLLLPSLVAPTLWLRRCWWQRAGHGGFEVIATAPATLGE